MKLLSSVSYGSDVSDLSNIVMGKIGKKSGVDSDPNPDNFKTDSHLPIIIRSRLESSEAVRNRQESSGVGVIWSRPKSSGVVRSRPKSEVVRNCSECSEVVRSRPYQYTCPEK